MEEFSAIKVHIQPATWLTRKFPSRRMSRHYWPVWVWSKRKIRTFSGKGGLEKRVLPKGEIHPFSGEGGLGGGEKVSSIAAGAYHPDSSYSRHQTLWFVFFPATLSFQGHIISSTSPSQQKFAEQIDWVPLERAVMWLISGYCAIWTVHVLEKVLL